MSSVNNLKGKKVKDGKVVYSEKINDKLYFNIILMYNERTDKNWHQGSSEIYCNATISTGERSEFSNGVVSLKDAIYHEEVKGISKFKPLENDLITKDGYRVFQKDYNYSNYEEEIDGKKVKISSRNVMWLIEVPKMDLLRYCKIN